MGTIGHSRGCRVIENSKNLHKTRVVEWWRRGESEYSAVLKTRKLLKNEQAQNSKNAEIAPNWNVSGTREDRASTTDLREAVTTYGNLCLSIEGPALLSRFFLGF